jgi:stalled ribosome rescue protein Dom34
MSEHYHAVIWIDHHEAHVVHFNADTADEKTVHAHHSPRHLHSKVGSASGSHVTAEPEFYRDVAAAITDAHEILVVGPSSAKAEFVKYAKEHAPQVSRRIAGVETLQRVSDPQLVAEGRRFFAQEDRMRPQIG